MTKFLAPHQTVGWMIQQLQEYPMDMKVVFATGIFDQSCWLSDYLIEPGNGFEDYLCIDIGDDS